MSTPNLHPGALVRLAFPRTTPTDFLGVVRDTTPFAVVVEWEDGSESLLMVDAASSPVWHAGMLEILDVDPV